MAPRPTGRLASASATWSCRTGQLTPAGRPRTGGASRSSWRRGPGIGSGSIPRRGWRRMLTFSRSGIHGLRLDKPQDDVAVALAGAAHFNGPASAPRVRAFNHCVLDLVKRELRSNDGDLIDLTD